MNRKQKRVCHRLVAAFLAATVVFTLDFLFAMPLLLRFALYLAPYLLLGYDVLLRAVKGILRRQVFDENFLMALATVGALCLFDFAEAVAVMFFYQVGELFESIAVGRSRKSIAALMDIRPDTANLYENGEIFEVAPEEVEVGAVIAVNPGERIPLDGRIIEGKSSLNTVALTGESLPRDVEEGDFAVSGAINLTGRILIETSCAYESSTVSRILDLIENSVMKKSRSEHFITRFARYYTPIVVIGALLLALLPPLFLSFFGHEPTVAEWISRALTFLVISCPCALVISVPLSFFGGLGACSRKGILIKGSLDLESLAEVSTLVFDKTGTLTNGSFSVSEAEAVGVTEEELLMLAAYAESASSHPIAQCLVSAYGQPVLSSRISAIEESAGFGVTAVIDGQSVSVGNRRLMERVGAVLPEESAYGCTVYLAREGIYIGRVILADGEKVSAKESIALLKKCGIEKTVMLTGDSPENAARVATSLGIDRFEASLLPADKVAFFERIATERKGAYGKCAFVGDGINDAPVLARADVGIAMGALGSDAAIEASDVVLMDDDLRKIAAAIRISRKTLLIVRQNIVLALGVKAICLLLGALGYANLWLAVFADVGVMVLAVLNAMRTLRLR